MYQKNLPLVGGFSFRKSCKKRFTMFLLPKEKKYFSKEHSHRINQYIGKFRLATKNEKLMDLIRESEESSEQEN